MVASKRLPLVLGLPSFHVFVLKLNYVIAPSPVAVATLATWVPSQGNSCMESLGSGELKHGITLIAPSPVAVAILATWMPSRLAFSDAFASTTWVTRVYHTPSYWLG